MFTDFVNECAAGKAGTSAMIADEVKVSGQEPKAVHAETSA
jgi:hypothetical protein